MLNPIDGSLGEPIARRQFALTLPMFCYVVSCVILTRLRTPEPTPTAEHWFLSAFSPKAPDGSGIIESSLTLSRQPANWGKWNQHLRASVRRHRRALGTREARRDPRPLFGLRPQCLITTPTASEIRLIGL